MFLCCFSCHLWVWFLINILVEVTFWPAKSIRLGGEIICTSFFLLVLMCRETKNNWNGCMQTHPRDLCSHQQSMSSSPSGPPGGRRLQKSQGGFVKHDVIPVGQARSRWFAGKERRNQRTRRFLRILVSSGNSHSCYLRSTCENVIIQPK